MLEIRSLESDLIVSVCKSMPQTLRCDLLGRLTACLEPDALPPPVVSRGNASVVAEHFDCASRFSPSPAELESLELAVFAERGLFQFYVGLHL